MQWAKPKEHRDEQAHEQNTKKQTEGKQNPTKPLKFCQRKASM